MSGIRSNRRRQAELHKPTGPTKRSMKKLQLLMGRMFYASKGQIRKAGAVPGRNDLCPCGSGKKYKYCCGK